MPRQMKTTQFDLFSTLNQAEMGQTLHWQARPAQTRELMLDFKNVHRYVYAEFCRVVPNGPYHACLLKFLNCVVQ